MVLVVIMNVLTNGAGLLVLLPFIAIGYGVWWLYRYRSLTTKDVDYPVAVRSVKLTIIVWLMALLLSWAITVLNVVKHGVAP
jgi:hypothetical protein